MVRKKDKYINAGNLSLDEWLQLLESPPKEVKFIDYEFPTDAHRDEYLKSIKDRSVEEVKRLLRHFLMSSVSLGIDEFRLQWFIESKKLASETFEKLIDTDYYRRLLLWAASRGKTPPPWEGITWVLDLLPHWPRDAVAALNAYFLAHAQALPDGRLIGLGEAIEIIRAKFIGVPGNQQETIEFLRELNPRHFECLVERLYNEMGYETKLTPPSKDGGRDILAKQKDPGRSETLLIECKRYSRSVGIDRVRALLGVVSDEKVNKGVMVTSGSFTRGARRFTEKNPRIELIECESLALLLNEFLGASWTLHIDRLILESIRANEETSKTDR